MIAWLWSGTARPDKADAYARHLQDKTFPLLASIPGHRGAYVLRRDVPEMAVVPPEAKALLVSYDTRAVHWEVAYRTEASFPHA